MNSVNDLQHIFYINLETRPDRNQMALSEFETLGWAHNPMRFNAARMANGAIGCSISHIKCIEYAKQMNWSHVVVCEDDIKFTQPEVFTENLNMFLSSGIEWDVVLLAGNNIGRFRQTGKGAVQVQLCQAATGYLVRREYFDTIINNFKEGLRRFLHDPTNKPNYAIDRYWFLLQNKDRWFLIYPLTVTQQTNYSDIENRHTNYDKMMLTLDKSDWFKQPLQRQTNK